MLQQVGTPYEIYNRPANLFVADFMGSPSMNLLNGKVARAQRRGASSCWSAPTAQPIVLPAPRGADASKLADGREVIIGIRPEAITDLDGADRHSERRVDGRRARRSGAAGGLRHIRRHHASPARK